jgi:hypothetical protein
LSLLAFLASISCHSHALHVAHSSYPVHPAWACAQPPASIMVNKWMP